MCDTSDLKFVRQTIIGNTQITATSLDIEHLSENERKRKLKNIYYSK